MKPIFKNGTVLALLCCLSLAGSAWGAMTEKATLTDYLHTGFGTAKKAIDMENAGNETPFRAYMAAPTSTGAASGFKWGGYYVHAPAGTGTNLHGILIMDNNPQGIILNYSWVGGSHFYTLFDSAGGNAPDQYVNLSGPRATFSINPRYGAAATTGQTSFWTVRVMLRANAGAQWYVSEPVTLPQLTTTAAVFTFGIPALKWYAVSPTVNTNLNDLAAADEQPLAWGASPVTPDFSKVDGGGFYNVDVTGTDTAFIGKFMGAAFCFHLPTWTADNPVAVPTVKAVCAPSYPNDASALVLTPGVAQSGTITVGAVSTMFPVVVTSAVLNDPAHEFTATGLPTATTTLNAANPNFVVNVSWTPSAADNKESSASLRLTCNSGGVAGKVIDIPIRGRDLVNGSIYQSFDYPYTPGSVNIARAQVASAFVVPTIMRPPTAGVGGTGFAWGGYSAATATNSEGRDWVTIRGTLAFLGTAADDTVYSACKHGSYAYGLFDTMGTKGTTPPALYIDRAVNLHKIQYNCNYLPPGSKVRWLIRDYLGQWFLSKDVTNIGALPTFTYHVADIETFGLGWLRVNSTAEAFMNDIANALPGNTVSTVAIDEPNTLASGTPNAIATSGFKVTGVGVYVEQGNTDPSNSAIGIVNFNLLAQPTSGDTFQTSKTTVLEAIKVPNRRLALAGLALDVTPGTVGMQGETAFDKVTVNVTPNTSGLRSLIMVEDFNANGQIDSGEAELTSCSLDAGGIMANLTFKNILLVNGGAPRNLILTGVFDETAAGKTYNFSIPNSAWRQFVDDGGTDTVVSKPTSFGTAITVGSVTFPSTDELIVSTPVSETWDSATAGAVPSTAASGSLSGTNQAWTYTWNGTTQPLDASFAMNNGSMALGNQTMSMTTEANYLGGISYNTQTPFLLNFNQDNTRVIKLAFDLTITSTSYVGGLAHLSGRANADKTIFTLRLSSLGDTDAYSFRVYPVLDANYYLFDISSTVSGITYSRQSSPKSIHEYGPTPAYTGRYRFVIWLAPYSTGQATIAKVEMQQVETGKTVNWLTVLDGKVPNFKNLRLVYGPFPDNFIDNIALTSYSFRLNPVQHWSMFE